MGSSVVYPPYTGDSRRIYRIAQAIRTHGIPIEVIGKNYRIDTAGNVTVEFRYDFHRDSRIRAGLRTLLRNGHYNETKHATRLQYRRVVPALQSDRYGCIYVGAPYLVPMVLPHLRGRRMIVDTHNSEWVWFSNLAKGANPLVRRVCESSKARIDAIMRMLPNDTVLVHVTPGDLEDYRERRPDLTHLVVPNGCDIQPRKQVPDYADGPRTLLFFGSLGSKMSIDSLTFFRNKFWPQLKGNARVLVAGAHPRREIIEMCSVQGWDLRRDLSDAEVAAMFGEVHYSVLPFDYGAGSKLKFLDACGRGVPVLATRAGACGQTEVPSYVTISDDPAVWLETVRKGTGPGPDWQAEVRAYGDRFEWENVVKPVLPILAGCKTCP